MTGIPTLDLEPFREKLKREMISGVQNFDGDGPITRVDVWYDLVSMEVPMVRLYLDNHPTGEPSSGSSDEIDLMEIELPEWTDACHAECAAIQYGENSIKTDDEESLCEAVGLFLLEIILSIRDAGILSSLPRGEKCYIGVSTYDGVWGWPVWEERGVNDLV